MLAVSFEIPGSQSKVFSRAFTRFGEGAKDLSAPFEKIGSDLRNKIIKQQFKTGGAAKSIPWKALSPAYAKRKAKSKYRNKPLMVRTGKMRKALTRKGGDNLAEAHKLWAMFGVKDGDILKRAMAHQYGRGNNLPQRPLIALEEFDRVRWTKIIQRHITKVAREAEKAAGGA